MSQNLIFYDEYKGEKCTIRYEWLLSKSDCGEEIEKIVSIARQHGQVDAAREQTLRSNPESVFQIARSIRQNDKQHFTWSTLTEALDMTYYARQWPQEHQRIRRRFAGVPHL